MRIITGARFATAALLAPIAASAGGQTGAGPGTPTLVGEAESMDVGVRINPAARAMAADPATGQMPALRRTRDRAVAARRDELVVGSAVRDSSGVPIARIAALGAEAVVLETDAGRQVEVAYDAFGRNRAGLLVGITKAQFDAAVDAAQQVP